MRRSRKRPTLALTLIMGLIMGASPLCADSIAGFIAPAEVRRQVLEVMADWAGKPISPTGCQSGPCCSDTTLDDKCAAAGDPLACCDGLDSGTCSEDACEAFSRVIVGNPVGWVSKVEEDFRNQGATYECETFQQGDINTNRTMTVCTALPANMLAVIAGRLSYLAQVETF